MYDLMYWDETMERWITIDGFETEWEAKQERDARLEELYASDECYNEDFYESLYRVEYVG